MSDTWNDSANGGGAVIGSIGGQPVTPLDPAEVDRLVRHGRALQGAALRAAFAGLFRFLVHGCSLRGLRLNWLMPPERRQSCC